jgi:hypothetical protein
VLADCAFFNPSYELLVGDEQRQLRVVAESASARGARQRGGRGVAARSGGKISGADVDESDRSTAIPADVLIAYIGRRTVAACGPRLFGGMQMSFGRMASLVIAIVAVLGDFIFIGIPIVSNFAFWVLAAAYLVMIGTTKLWR